jgi:hypothetical protein
MPDVFDSHLKPVSEAPLAHDCDSSHAEDGLGVALRAIALSRGQRIKVMTADNSALTEGFHAFESDLNLRWTNGAALVPASLFEDWDKPMRLELHLDQTTFYPDVDAAA